jgi:hypothetical protein
LRWLALVAGIALVALAFGAGSRVADTREGLIAEVITLFSGLAGVALLVYGFVARPGAPAAPPRLATGSAPAEHARSVRDLLAGVGGIVLALALLTGLAMSGGAMWAGFGLVLLLPMLAGSVYLCVRYLRASL